MSNLPNELRYSKSHEWVRTDGANTVTIGITDFAQSQLGDLVFVELPDLDSEVKTGDEIAVVESVKTAADVYSPVTGKVIAVNEDLAAAPEQVNQDPYGSGWLFKIVVADENALRALLSAEDYQNTIADN